MLEENIEFEYVIFMMKNNYNISYDQLNNYLKQNSYLNDRKITEEGLKLMENHPIYYYGKYELDLLTCKKICLKFLDKFYDDEVNELKSEIYNK